MLKIKLSLLYYAMKMALCSCASEENKGFVNFRPESSIVKIGTLPQVANESSGLAKASDSTFYTHNDSGGENELFEIDKKGKLINTLKVHGAKNKDWEELAEDDKGNIYIGDFGNNSQKRKDLVIYKVKDGISDEIEFKYKDQKDFPADKKNFDCEAFFWFNGELHLFSKGKEPKELITKHYVIPDEPGKYSIKPKEELILKETVTAADISPDKSMFALLTYGKVLFFGIENQQINFDHPLGCLKTKRKQTEAILFISNSEIIFSNEQQELFLINLNSKNKLNN
jgi:hypothetical protein